MRDALAVAVLAGLAGCAFQAVSDGPQDGGATSGGTTGSAPAGTTGAPGPGSGGCGTDDCPACTTPYSCRQDSCQNGSWQCGCGCLDGGNPGCGGIACPVGCEISADCSTCLPSSPTAGQGTVCESDLDCCTGTCNDGLCGAAPCGSEGQPCESVDDCCVGFICQSGPIGSQATCTFLGGVDSGPPDAGGGCEPGEPPFAGNWGGTFSVAERLGSNGGGGGGRDQETVVAQPLSGQYLFQDFLSVLLADCSLEIEPQGPTVASVVPTACKDTAGGVWTFSSGEVVLAGPCSMSVSASGNVDDPSESGTFTLGLSLTQ